jgi:hypothetical protein
MRPFRPEEKLVVVQIRIERDQIGASQNERVLGRRLFELLLSYCDYE